jgi:hypothetical protein
MRKLHILFATLGIVGCVTGCGTTRTVVINASEDVVRLGRGVRGEVYIWRDGQWVRAGRATLPEGWYAGPGPRTMP